MEEKIPNLRRTTGSCELGFVPELDNCLEFPSPVAISSSISSKLIGASFRRGARVRAYSRGRWNEASVGEASDWEGLSGLRPRTGEETGTGGAKRFQLSARVPLEGEKGCLRGILADLLDPACGGGGGMTLICRTSELFVSPAVARCTMIHEESGRRSLSARAVITRDLAQCYEWMKTPPGYQPCTLTSAMVLRLALRARRSSK